MSQRAPGNNKTPPRAWLLLAGAAWAVTMAQVLRSEVLTRRESADVRALVESARLTEEHASARYVIRAGEAVIGQLSSTVSGGREEEQLAYVLDGELHSPLVARLKGAVIAGWDRRPDRFVLELTVGDQRHRLDGGRSTTDDLFHIRYLQPGGAPAPDAFGWVLDEAPVLAAGALPVPVLDRGGPEGRSGAVPDPVSGGTLSWELDPLVEEELPIAGEVRVTHRRRLHVGGIVLTAWTDESGFPLRAELPGGIVIELVEETR